MKILALIIAALAVIANIIGYLKGDITPGEVLVVYMLIGIFINTTKEIK